jgi:enterochelin esterase-like enzyme
VDAAGVTFRLADPSGRLDAVRLAQELGIEQGLDFRRHLDGWQLSLPRPAVDRMEYLLEIVDHNGQRATITDPGNPLRVPGAFAEKSVVQFPDYREPAWLALPVGADSMRRLSIDTRAHDVTITGALWSPESLPAGEPAPMLVVHDGPEYATLGSFTHYLNAMIAAGTLPPLRAALLDPGDRNGWYAANPAYATALCTEVVPELDRLAPATVRIGVGVSLGALAMLHAQWSYPATFGGLLLQSGSFFTPQLDPQESGFSGFGPVTDFVAGVVAGAGHTRAVPVTMTCGAVEENLGNNQKMAATLARRGYPVDFHVLRDAHNYTAWRDGLDPGFTDLVASLVGSHAA